MNNNDNNNNMTINIVYIIKLCKLKNCCEFHCRLTGRKSSQSPSPASRDDQLASEPAPQTTKRACTA